MDPRTRSTLSERLAWEEARKLPERRGRGEMEESHPEAAGPSMAKPSDEEPLVSDDDEIDYSIKPEFYDPTLDDKDELWVLKKRSGRTSDAILSCPACFTTLCLDCQRHAKYCTQYRAMFVVNCKIESSDILRPSSRKRQREMVPRVISENPSDVTADHVKAAPLRPVCCSACGTEVGALDEDEVYHFFNVLPSES